MIKTIKRYLADMKVAESLWTGQSDDMVAMHGADGRFLRVSESAMLVVGCEAEALVGKTLAEITAPDDRGVAMQALAEACYLGHKGRAEFRILRADGTTGWAEMTVSVSRDGQVRSVIRDVAVRHAHDVEQVTARKKAEAEAEARSSYLADLSHEVRTPLNAVIGFADMMRSETFGPIGHEKYTEYAGLIHKSGQHLLDLVSDLLDISKIEAGKYQLDIAASHIPSLVTDCLDMVRLEAERAGLELAADFSADFEISMMVDPKALRQMVLNLLSNAIKFTKKGKVVVRLRSDQNNFWISVIDTGIGMSAPELARIGQRFAQAHREGVRGTRGTGLGLALSHALASLHDGELRLASVLGEGTSAVIRLPHLRVVAPTDEAGVVEEALPLLPEGDGLFESLGHEIEEKLQSRKSA